MNYPVTRTPEQGHTAKCLAKALICAIENIRDSQLDDDRRCGTAFADYEFRLAAQRNDFLHEADGYLTDGITECVCPAPEPPDYNLDAYLATVSDDERAVIESLTEASKLARRGSTTATEEVRSCRRSLRDWYSWSDTQIDEYLDTIQHDTTTPVYRREDI